MGINKAIIFIIALIVFTFLVGFSAGIYNSPTPVEEVNVMRPNYYGQLQDLNATLNDCVWRLEKEWNNEVRGFETRREYIR